jgi:hypothetical protein
VEHGAHPDDALKRIKEITRGLWSKPCPETAEQTAMVRQWQLTLRDRVRGCLLGGAVGDALGAPVEFMSYPEIKRRYGRGGIRDFAAAYGRVGAITDDTQMTLFTAEGLLRAHNRSIDRGICHPPSVVWRAYQRWLSTQGGRVDRVPGVGRASHCGARLGARGSKSSNGGCRCSPPVSRRPSKARRVARRATIHSGAVRFAA